MTLKSNIPEFIKKLEAVKAAIGTTGTPPSIPDISDAMLSASNAGMGKLKFRIFNEGLDANNESLGKYTGPKTKLTKARGSKTKYSIFGLSVQVDADGEKERKKQKKNFNDAIKADADGQYTEYEKYRLSLGRQIAFKDLEVEGSLRRSIETIKIDNGKIVMAITNKETALIAGYQEKQIGDIRGTDPVPIFVFSQEEYDFVQREGNAAIGQIIKQLFNQL